MRSETMAPILKNYLSEYGMYHQTLGNKVCHTVGIPLIVLSTFTFLSTIPLVSRGGFILTVSEITLLAVTLYYIRLDPILGAFMFVALLSLDFIGREIPWRAAIALFIFGWVLQFLGHYCFEKRSPAFFRNLTHLLIGPLWIVARATGRV